MSSYYRLTAEALPNPGTEGTWERRMVEGIVNLGSLGGQAVQPLSGQGPWLEQLWIALDRPFDGSTRTQLLVGGSKRDLWLQVVAEVAGIGNGVENDNLLLSGDQQSGSDQLLLSGDAQTGTDSLKLEGIF